ncbi:MAG TPA: CehA/McbA family metallohydrolase [Mesorhizobium sp.]|nr:CehA/McbA family metallohydrolase [Mesorhizobium sp.]
MTDIAPFSLPGRFWRGNIHTHSTLSDGALAPDQVVEAYRRAGYDFLQLSEHFMERFGWPIADTRRFRTNNFTTLIGAELHAPSTTVGELWHVVAAGLPLDFEPCARDETGPEIARRAREAGAFVGIAHPAWSQLTIEDGRALESAHAVEIYNHGCAVENDRGDGWYLLDQLLNEGKRLMAFATDDAHLRNGDYDVFGGWVHVKAPSLDPADLLEALKAGNFYSSQGPQIHELSILGNELSIVTSPIHTVAILCGTSRAVTRVGRHVTHGTHDLTVLREHLTRGKVPQWIRLIVIDAGGRRAWTNPIWLDGL